MTTTYCWSIGALSQLYHGNHRILYFVLVLPSFESAHWLLFKRYWNSVQNVPRVGRYLARFIKFLTENEVDMQRLHVVGFSLGAEVAGYAGKMLKEWNLPLPRITGKRIIRPQNTKQNALTTNYVKSWQKPPIGCNSWHILPFRAWFLLPSLSKSQESLLSRSIVLSLWNVMVMLLATHSIRIVRIIRYKLRKCSTTVWCG